MDEVKNDRARDCFLADTIFEDEIGGEANINRVVNRLRYLPQNKQINFRDYLKDMRKD